MFTTQEPDDLTNKIQFLLDNPEVVEKYRNLAVKRIAQEYTWEKITNDYERLFMRMLRLKNE